MWPHVIFKNPIKSLTCVSKVFKFDEISENALKVIKSLKKFDCLYKRFLQFSRLIWLFRRELLAFPEGYTVPKNWKMGP